MKHSISLATLNLFLVLLSLMVFIALLALLLFFGLEATQDAWYAQQISSIQKQIESQLLEVYGRDGFLSEQAVSLALEDAIQEPTYLMVSDPERTLLYSYHKTDRSAGRARGFQYGIQDNQDWIPLRNGEGSIIAYYTMHLPTFSEVEANALLLAAAKNVLVWALLIAFLVAVVLAFLFFLPLKKRSKELSAGLTRMADRERDVILEQSRVTEFADIAEAAGILQANLIHEERLRRQWAADVAHDLRSPVTVLKGQLEGVADGVLQLDEKRIALFLAETQKLTYLINDLSLLTHLESPEYQVHTECIAIDAVIQRLMARFAVQIAERNMQFSYVPHMASLHADPNLFSRLLDNLVSNAIRYGEDSSSIDILVEEDGQGNALSLSIGNEGTIEESFIPRLFDRLSKAEAARSSE
ncbi:MAG: sensor histidine kinase, partial [Sphaerochaetaceae bacterium]